MPRYTLTPIEKVKVRGGILFEWKYRVQYDDRSEEIITSEPTLNENLARESVVRQIEDDFRPRKEPEPRREPILKEPRKDPEPGGGGAGGGKRGQAGFPD